jgi:DNA-binding MarR family transcriptional regulator
MIGGCRQLGETMSRPKTKIKPVAKTPMQRVEPDAKGKLRERMLWHNALTTAWRLNYIANFYAVPFYLALEQRIGISRPEYVILFCAAQHPGVTAQEIVMATGRPKNSISVAVSKLERKRLIIRRPNETDLRHMELRATPEGLVIFQRIVPLLAQRERQMVKSLSEAERRQFDALLMKIARTVPGWATPDLSTLSPAGKHSRVGKSRLAASPRPSVTDVARGRLDRLRK